MSEEPQRTVKVEWSINHKGKANLKTRLDFTMSKESFGEPDRRGNVRDDYLDNLTIEEAEKLGNELLKSVGIVKSLVETWEKHDSPGKSSRS